MGSLFGGLLSAAGHEVWLLEVWEAHVDAINSDGLTMSFEGQERVVEPRATRDAAEAGECDLVMVWCKSADTEAALIGAKPMLGPETVVCTLQNGIGHVEVIESFVERSKLAYGITVTGALMKGPAHIELTESAWSGGGDTVVGARDERGMEAAELVAETLVGAGIAARTSADVDVAVWKKLATACPMAPLVAITRLRIGDVNDSDEMHELLAALCDEVVAVAQAEGVPLDATETREEAFSVWRAVATHVSSMGQDVLAGRRTEIDSLSGAIAERGRRHGVETPRNDMSARLVRLVERHFDDRLDAVR